MSPSILKANEVSVDSDFDLQKWLKEIESAENLMDEVEAKADNLQAKVNALLLEVGQPVKIEEDVAMVEATEEDSKVTVATTTVTEEEKETKKE